MLGQLVEQLSGPIFGPSVSDHHLVGSPALAEQGLDERPNSLPLIQNRNDHRNTHVYQLCPGERP